VHDEDRNSVYGARKVHAELRRQVTRLPAALFSI